MHLASKQFFWAVDEKQRLPEVVIHRNGLFWVHTCLTDCVHGQNSRADHFKWEGRGVISRFAVNTGSLLFAFPWSKSSQIQLDFYGIFIRLFNLIILNPYHIFLQKQDFFLSDNFLDLVLTNALIKVVLTAMVCSKRWVFLLRFALYKYTIIAQWELHALR